MYLIMQNSRSLKEAFDFVLQSMFSFSNIEILTVPKTNLLLNFWQLGTVDPIFDLSYLCPIFDPI